MILLLCTAVSADQPLYMDANSQLTSALRGITATLGFTASAWVGLLTTLIQERFIEMDISVVSADVVDLTPINSKENVGFLGHDQRSVQLPKLEKLRWIQISNMIGFILNDYLYNTKSLKFEWDFL